MVITKIIKLLVQTFRIILRVTVYIFKFVSILSHISLFKFRAHHTYTRTCSNCLRVVGRSSGRVVDDNNSLQLVAMSCITMDTYNNILIYLSEIYEYTINQKFVYRTLYDRLCASFIMCCCSTGLSSLYIYKYCENCGITLVVC